MKQKYPYSLWNRSNLFWFLKKKLSFKKAKRIYAAYKPWQNLIKEYDLIQSLYFIWGIGNNLQFNRQMPHDIPLNARWPEDGHPNDRRYHSSPEWELEFILTETLLHSKFQGTKTLLDIRTAGDLINSLRYLNNDIDGLSVSGTDQTFQEFFRMSHRQFEWQAGTDLITAYRYFRIYCHPEVEPVFQRVFGMSPFVYFAIAYTITGMFLNRFVITPPFNSEIPNVTNEDFEKFFQKYTIGFKNLQAEITQHKKYDHRLFYCFNPIRSTPIIKIGLDLFCPMPTLLIWQATNGIFYHMISDPAYSTAIGHAFEEYTGYILNKANDPVTYTVHPEALYANGAKRTTDWIIEDATAVMFCECKAKRMTLSSKMELDFGTGIEADLEKIAKEITKVYKTFIDYKNGQYTNMPYRQGKKHYIHIISFEEWYLFFNIKLMDSLKANISNKLQALGIDPIIMQEVPFSTDSIDGFETEIQLIRALGIERYHTEVANNTIQTTRLNYPIKNLILDDMKADFIAKMGVHI